MSFSQSVSFFRSLYSNFSRADTASPHTPGNHTPFSPETSASPFPLTSASPLPLSSDPSRCSSPLTIISDAPQANSALAKPLVRKTVLDSQSIEQRIAFRFENILKKTNKSQTIDALVQSGWSTQTLHVVNLQGVIKEKQFYVHNAPLEQSAQVTTNPSLRLSKGGTIKAYVKCTQKDTSEKSRTAFEEKKLELFSRAALVQVAPKIYLCPNLEAQKQQEVVQNKYHNTFITKYVEDGDLINFLLSVETDDVERIDISRKLILQVQVLHKNGIFHRDIKLDNVLIDHFASEVKICDYGLATDSLVSQERPCSIEYAPPNITKIFF